MRLALIVAAVVMLASGAIYVSRGSASAAGSCDASTTETTVEQQMVTLINAYRATNGLPALTVSPVLSRAAHWMANDLATNHYFAHEPDSLGRSYVQRSHDCGIAGFFGENLAEGTGSAAETLGAWEGSPPHNAALLNKGFAQIGIAVQGGIWAADFGSQQSGSVPTSQPTKTPTPTVTPTRTPAASLLCPGCGWREYAPEVGDS